jgi:hypothetical protein
MGKSVPPEIAAQMALYASYEDEDSWGEPERAPSAPKRRLASMISARFSPDEAAMIRQAAANAGESLSHFVRTAALERSRTWRDMELVNVPTYRGQVGLHEFTISAPGLLQAQMITVEEDPS